jgi:hypothetical protein
MPVQTAVLLRRTSATPMRTSTLPAGRTTGFQLCCRSVAHPSTPSDCSWPAWATSLYGLPLEDGLGTSCVHAWCRPPKPVAVKVLQARNWKPVEVVQPRNWKLRPRNWKLLPTVPQHLRQSVSRTSVWRRADRQSWKLRPRNWKLLPTVPQHLRQSVSRTAVWCRGDGQFVRSSQSKWLPCLSASLQAA